MRYRTTWHEKPQSRPFRVLVVEFVFNPESGSVVNGSPTIDPPLNSVLAGGGG